MARQSKSDQILAEREAALELKVRQVATEVERLNGELALVRDLRKQLATPPRKASVKP